MQCSRTADHHRARFLWQRPGRHPDAAGGRAGRDPVGASDRPAARSAPLRDDGRLRRVRVRRREL